MQHFMILVFCVFGLALVVSLIASPAAIKNALEAAAEKMDILFQKLRNRRLSRRKEA